MKRILLLTVVVGLFAGQASAALWEVDKPTALGMTSEAMTAGVSVPPQPGPALSVYDGPNTKVYGPGGTTYGGTQMSGAVGFVATIADNVTPGHPTMKIYNPDPGLVGAGYDGISMYFQNDNDDHWLYQLFFVAGGTEYRSPDDGDASFYEHIGDFVHLAGGSSTVLTVLAPGGPGTLDLSAITEIGFRVGGHELGTAGHGSNPDTFHTSVVPVPAAVLLGFLGLGAAGLKLRRFA